MLLPMSMMNIEHLFLTRLTVLPVQQGRHGEPREVHERAARHAEGGVPRPERRHLQPAVLLLPALTSF